MCAQQQRQPSPEPPSQESPVVRFEKMQESGEMSWQAKISVAASSRINSVTTRRVVDQCAMTLRVFYIDTIEGIHVVIGHRPVPSSSVLAVSAMFRLRTSMV